MPLPVGTKSIKYLEENIGALKVKLTPEEVEELESLIPHDQARHVYDVIGRSLDTEQAVR